MKGWTKKPAMGMAMHRSRIRRWLAAAAKTIQSHVSPDSRAWVKLTMNGIR